MNMYDLCCTWKLILGCVPAKQYESLLEEIDDTKLVQIVRDRKVDTEISTSVDELKNKI